MTTTPTTTPTGGIAFGAFVLIEGGLMVRGAPEIEDFRRALEFATHVENNSPMWKADLLDFGRSQPKWSAVIDHVIDAGAYTEASVRQYCYVARAVPAERRMPGLSFGHHAEVASLPPVEQTEWLTRAKAEDLSAQDLRREIRSSRSRRVASGQAADLATAQAQVRDAAWLAQQACREIGHSDCKQAEAKIAEARKHLEQCERYVRTLRKLTG